MKTMAKISALVLTGALLTACCMVAQIEEDAEEPTVGEDQQGLPPFCV
jgi:hypothetical protein